MKVAIGGVIGLTCALEWAGAADRSRSWTRRYLCRHWMMGVTLAPSTGAALAPLILEDSLVPELRPFRIGR